jgi:WhiB family redox-sensing transcriptional regulator
MPELSAPTSGGYRRAARGATKGVRYPPSDGKAPHGVRGRRGTDLRATTEGPLGLGVHMTEFTLRLPTPTQDEWEWQYAGACHDADPNLFFHPEGERGYARRRRAESAKRFCTGCGVLELCRERSLAAREPFGVWGGLSEDERNAVLAGRVLQPH